jgi:hypothetical protein
VRVERRGGEDDLREAGGGAERAVEVDAAAGVGHAVQRLRPPLVRRHAQPGDGRGLVPELRDLLLHRQPRHQVVGAPLHRQPLVAERYVGRLLAGAAGEGRVGGHGDML